MIQSPTDTVEGDWSKVRVLVKLKEVRKADERLLFAAASEAV